MHLLATAKTLWLRLDAVPWLIAYLKDQYDLGGVAPQRLPKEADSGEKPTGLWWDFRDCAWQAVAVDSRGRHEATSTRDAACVLAQRASPLAVAAVPR